MKAILGKLHVSPMVALSNLARYLNMICVNEKRGYCEKFETLFAKIRLAVFEMLTQQYFEDGVPVSQPVSLNISKTKGPTLATDRSILVGPPALLVIKCIFQYSKTPSIRTYNLRHQFGMVLKVCSKSFVT